MNKSTAVLADAVDPRAIGTDTMRAVHYRFSVMPEHIIVCMDVMSKLISLRVSPTG